MDLEPSILSYIDVRDKSVVGQNGSGQNDMDKWHGQMVGYIWDS